VNAAKNPELLDAGATRIVRALADREVSALEICDGAIARIEDRDRAINAVVVRDFERARAQARQVDEALARGERRPLFGVPMTVKESFNVAGLTTTWGMLAARDFRPQEDAVAVARLKTAGAVILGKTNVPVGLGDWQSANPIYGRTVHPLDPTRTPGGSSGGAAAALAARMVPLELGSDIGGSIRVPAHFCGVFGHKSSHALVPRRGHEFPGYPGAPDVLSVVGPMARSAEDLDLALKVLAGPDTDEAVAYRLALPHPRHERISDYRVLVIGEHSSAAVASELLGAVARVAGELVRAGCRVEHHHALLPDLAAAHQAYGKTLMTIVSRGAPGAKAPISAHEWLGLLDARQQLRQRWHRFFEAFDVVLAPVLGTAAFEHMADDDWKARTLVIDGRATSFGAQMFWAGIATFPGLPATVAPAGRTGAGMPIGVQIIGPYLEDRTTIAVARWIETVLV
jgi:amidase